MDAGGRNNAKMAPIVWTIIGSAVAFIVIHRLVITVVCWCERAPVGRLQSLAEDNAVGVLDGDLDWQTFPVGRSREWHTGAQTRHKA
jgi:hypothetical protein